MFYPEILESFKELVATGKVELLNETYFHSLSYLYKKEEFVDQVLLHRKKIWQLFRKKPQVFRNTELIYSDSVAEYAKRLGFKAILSEGWDKYLHWRSPNFLYKAKPTTIGFFNEKMLINKRFREEIDPDIFLLLKNYKLSDDIAFRFSNRKWTSYPLTTEKYANWLQKTPGETINLFMDYETFGEHQWEDSGIFKFLEQLPEELKKNNIGFRTPSETIKQLEVKDTISVPNLLSWADNERDLSAWNQNKMQKEALKKVFELTPLVRRATRNMASSEEAQKILTTWRYLQTSDHFYYMSTKYMSDGDIHSYFSHYESPYDAYINYMNILNNFRQKLLLAK
jgi:alpha-amylase